jgi:hypothetical protein
VTTPRDFLIRGLGQVTRERKADRASEFGHGPGLTPRGLQDATEAEGGRYRDRTPPVVPDLRMNRATAGKPGGPSIQN